MNAALVALALTAGTADAGPYMWGVGPSLSTMVMPGEHPLSWPVAKKIDGDRPAVAPYGKNDSGRISEPYFEKVRGDVSVGAKGLFYLNKDWRGVAHGQFGFGSNYRSSQFSLGVDKIIGGESGAFAFVGGGLGVGSMRWESTQDSAKLKVQNFPLKAQFGGYYKINGKSAVELSIFAQLPMPSIQTLTTDDGTEIDMGVGLNPLAFTHFGLELTGYFGDFMGMGGKMGKGGKKGKKKRR
jgi:hypothetical protein